VNILSINFRKFDIGNGFVGFVKSVRFVKSIRSIRFVKSVRLYLTLYTLRLLTL
jgi:hypothetical protein